MSRAPTGALFLWKVEKLMSEKKPKLFKIIIASSILLYLIVCFYCCSWFHSNNNTPATPTPTPTVIPKHKVVVTWNAQKKCLLYDGKVQPVIGVGDYCLLEPIVCLRNHHPDAIVAYLEWLQSHKVNYQRIFVECRFSQTHLENIGIPTQQIFRQNVQGKYILTTNPAELNKEWLDAVDWYVDLAAEHGVFVVFVQVDQCGHKVYNTDEYGWIKNPYNFLNNLFGYWDYSGSNMFKYYHFIDRPWKFPHLREVRLCVTRAFVHRMRNKTNVGWEITNEGAPCEGHLDYPAFENFIIDQIWNFYPSNKVKRPIICDSSEGRYVKDRCDYTCSHGLQEEGDIMRSTDGRRCTADGKAGFQAKMINIYQSGGMAELHYAYPSKCITHNGIPADPDDVNGFCFYNKFPAPIPMYEKYIGPWLNIMRNAAESKSMIPAMMINEFYDPTNTGTDKKDGSEYPF